MHIVCDENHRDYEALRGILSDTYQAGDDSSVTIADSSEGWVSAYKALVTAHETEEPSVIVFDVSSIRPSGSVLRKGGKASGPRIFIDCLRQTNTLCNSNVGELITSTFMLRMGHAIANCIVAGSIRRSGLLAVKHWLDHDIYDFIKIKQVEPFWTYNLSVIVDDLFFKEYAAGDPIATNLYNNVVTSMLANGEPGIWNITAASVGELETPIAPNLCAELAMPAYSCCDLSSINLGHPDHQDVAALTKSIQINVRFLVRSTFAPLTLPQSREVVDRERRIGAGIMGYHDWLTRKGIAYGAAAYDEAIHAEIFDMFRTAKITAHDYAFLLRIPEPVKVTCCAPNGTTSFLPGVAPGIQPVYAKYGIRRVRYPSTDPQLDIARAANLTVEPDLAAPNTMVVEYPYKSHLFEITDKPEIVQDASNITVRDYLQTACMFQSLYADNSVSYTINIDPSLGDDIRANLIKALPMLKGITVLPDGAYPQSPEERITEDQYEMTHLKPQFTPRCSNGVCGIGNEEPHFEGE